MIEKFLIIPIAILFSMPDIRIAGVTTQTLLFLLILPASFFLSKFIVSKKFIRFNLPFIFLLTFSILSILIYALHYYPDDIYFIISKNKDMLTEVLLAYIMFVLVWGKGLSLQIIRRFIEMYFLLNFIYLLVSIIYPEVAIPFHQSDKNIMQFIHGRERLLGWEPSYTVPVSVLFSLIYLAISKSKSKSIFISIFTVYIFYIGQSKIGYILLFTGLFLLFYYKFLSKLKYKKTFSFLSLVVFFAVLYLTFMSVANKLGYFNFDSRDRIHQYEIISFVTRSELITATIKEILINPLGYGYGTSIVHLSDSIDKNIINFQSFEIAESSKYGRSSKSQFLEYILSGGFLFLLLVSLQFKNLYKQTNMFIHKKKHLLQSTLILLIVTIIVGERIPYIFLITLIWLIIIVQIREQTYIKDVNLE